MPFFYTEKRALFWALFKRNQNSYCTAKTKTPVNSKRAGHSKDFNSLPLLRFQSNGKKDHTDFRWLFECLFA